MKYFVEIYGFANCGLIVQICGFEIFGLAHQNFFADLRKRGGGPGTEKISTQAAGLYINILYARAKNQPSHWEKRQSIVGDIAP